MGVGLVSACTLYFGPDDPGPGSDHAPYLVEAMTAHGAYGAYHVHISARVTDPDGDPVTCAFDPGDGRPGVELSSCAAFSVEHTYPTIGVYSARLTYADANGKQGTASLAIRVPFDPPIAHVDEIYERSTIVGGVAAIAYRADGAIITGDRARVSVWDPATGARIGGWDSGNVLALAPSPDGTRVAITTGETYAPVTSVRTTSGALFLDLGDPTAFAWSPDSRELALGYVDGRITVIQVGSGAVIANLTGHITSITAMAWSPDGTRLATGDLRGGLFFWRTDTTGLGAEIASSVSGLEIDALAWTRDSATLAVGGRFNIGFYSHDGAYRSGLQASDVTALAWSPDAKRLAYTASGDPKVRLLDPTSGASTFLIGHTNQARAVAWSADGAHVVTGADDATMRVWDASTRAEALRVAQLSPVDTIAWSPDGAHLATAGGSTLDVLDAATGERVGGVSDATAKALAWSPDGAQLAYGGPYGQVGRYDVATGAHGAWLASAARAIAWSGKGRIAVAIGDGTIGVWDATAGTLLRQLAGGSDVVAWSSDGFLATADPYLGVQIWDVDAGVAVESSNCVSQPTALAWNPVFDTLAIVGDTGGACIWDRTNDVTTTYSATADQLAWDSAGGKLAYGETAGSGVSIADPENAGLVLQSGGSPAWSPDGSLLAVGSSTGRTMVYRITYAP